MLDRLLATQRAIVTGASSGIGEAIALAFGQADASVVVNYRSQPEEAERVANKIVGRGGRAFPVQADVSKADDCKRLFEEAERRMGGLDILVANAGIQRDAAIADMTLEDWRAVIDLNLTGQFICAQEAVRCFRRRGLDLQRLQALGKIVFISSVHQRIPWAGHANYAAAKGGLKLLMESMAQELSAEKSRINAIAPGAIRAAINKSVGNRGGRACAARAYSLWPRGRAA